MSYVEQYMVTGSSKVSWGNSILLKIIAIVLTLTLVVIAISGYFAYRYIEETKIADLTNLAQVTSERLSHHLNGPMWAVDYEKVGALLEAEMNEAKISGIVVRDEDKQTLFAARERRYDGRVAVSLGAVIGSQLHSSHEIVRDGNVIGLVDVYLTKSYLNTELQGFAAGLSMFAALLGLVLTLAIGISLRSMVVKPIKQLTQSAQEISNGNLKQKIETNRDDEIGFLANTLDRMQYSLRVAINRIRTADARQLKNAQTAQA